MSQNQILAFSSSRLGNDEYLETAVPFIKEMIGVNEDLTFLL